jgi:hypothetical protein
MKAQAIPKLYPFAFRSGLRPLAGVLRRRGFETAWQEGAGGLRCGGACFVLQEIGVLDWQRNQMITFEVSNLDGYWSELEPKDLASPPS